MFGHKHAIGDKPVYLILFAWLLGKIYYFWFCIWNKLKNLYGTISNYDLEKPQDFQVSLKMVGNQLLTPNNLALSKPILLPFKAVVIVWSNLLIHKWDYKINPWIQRLHGQKCLVKNSTEIKGWWDNKARFSYVRLGKYPSRLELKPPLQKRRRRLLTWN